MRIIHVANHTRRFSGNVHAAIELACAQARQGHDVTVCSAGGSFGDLLEAHDVRVAHLVELADSAGAPRRMAPRAPGSGVALAPLAKVV